MQPCKIALDPRDLAPSTAVKGGKTTPEIVLEFPRPTQSFQNSDTIGQNGSASELLSP